MAALLEPARPLTSTTPLSVCVSAHAWLYTDADHKFERWKSTLADVGMIVDDRRLITIFDIAPDSFELNPDRLHALLAAHGVDPGRVMRVAGLHLKKRPDHLVHVDLWEMMDALRDDRERGSLDSVNFVLATYPSEREGIEQALERHGSCFDFVVDTGDPRPPTRQHIAICATRAMVDRALVAGCKVFVVPRPANALGALMKDLRDRVAVLPFGVSHTWASVVRQHIT